MSAFYHLYNIGRIHKFLSSVATKALLHAFVTSRVDYCNSLLYGLPVLNAAARLVSHAPRCCHVTPFLRELHWLPVRQRINYKILLLTFKTIHGKSPVYLQELISVKMPGVYRLKGHCHAIVP